MGKDSGSFALCNETANILVPSQLSNQILLLLSSLLLHDLSITFSPPHSLFLYFSSPTPTC